MSIFFRTHYRAPRGTEPHVALPNRYLYMPLMCTYTYCAMSIICTRVSESWYNQYVPFRSALLLFCMGTVDVARHLNYLIGLHRLLYESSTVNSDVTPFEFHLRSWRFMLRACQDPNPIRLASSWQGPVPGHAKRRGKRHIYVVRVTLFPRE